MSTSKSAVPASAIDGLECDDPTLEQQGAFLRWWLERFDNKIRAFIRQVARNVPYKSPPFWKGQAIAVLCVMGGLAIRLPLTTLIHNQIPVVLFYPFVLIASVWGGTLSGLTVLIVCGMVADYLWLPPAGSTLTLVAFSIACLSVIVMARIFRALVEQHAEGEQRADLLAHELQHRSNNFFGVVQAISAQAARSAASVEDYQALFNARIRALVQAQQLVSSSANSSPELHGFLTHIVEPFGPHKFVIDGPRVKVPHYLATSCGLLLHELSTNAVKYGALSVPEGMVAIQWRIEDDSVLLTWRERNGPPVATPARTGFGSRLLETAFPPAYGSAAIVFHRDGVQCEIKFVCA